MEKKTKYTRQDVIDFFNKYHRAPASVKERKLYMVMWRLIKGGDEELIALKEKYKSNTEKHAKQQYSNNGKIAAKRIIAAKLQKWPERISRIRKQFEETGSWPKPKTIDYVWIVKNKSRSEEVMKLWEDMNQGKSEEEKKKIRKPVEKTPAGIEVKKVSELTLSEISELLKLIGNRQVKDLLKKDEVREEVEVSSIETSLSEDVLRTIINPQGNKTPITNSEWETAKTLIEYMFKSKVLNNHLAAGQLLNNKEFIKEVAIFVNDNPKKRYLGRVDKICETLYVNLPADARFFENPANIRDLVSKCL